jgi:hypothetical protein
MSKSLTFTFPLPPNMTNGGRLHWRTKHRKQKLWQAACDTLQLTKVLPPPPKRPWAQAAVTATLTMWNPMDHDGAVSRCKWAIDWLVTRGYLVDDSASCLTWTGMPQQVIDRKHPASLTLVLEDVTP